jgi:hypothetical protein
LGSKRKARKERKAVEARKKRKELNYKKLGRIRKKKLMLMRAAVAVVAAVLKVIPSTKNLSHFFKERRGQRIDPIVLP